MMVESVGAQSVDIPVGELHLPGEMEVPSAAKGLVVFAHGSGSSRLSPRNQRVATLLHKRDFGTLLFDLLSAEEDRVSPAARFNIDVLADRLRAVCRWLGEREPGASLGMGLFGASTGAAAALITAAREPGSVRAVVSRGGRPDMAMDFLPQVRAPTLLVVGGLDTEVIALNRKAEAVMTTDCQLSIVEGASHLFEEGDSLDRVAELAADWFERHLREQP